MNCLANEIRYSHTPEGFISVFWLGQAGFILKNAAGETIGIDLYLTDCVSRYDGFKRLMPVLVEPQDLEVDTIVASHFHLDHFDVDAMPLLVHGKTRLVAANDCRDLCEQLHLQNVQFMKPGDIVEAPGFRIEAFPCDHGTLAPEAVGLLITSGGKRVYFTGDTAYRPDYFADARLKGVDLLICPINGAFGNMNEPEAVQAAAIIKPKRVIPSHYWNFAEQGGNPGVFMNQMKAVLPEAPFTVMRMGEKLVL